MSEAQIKLTGWPAVGVALLAVAFFGYKIFIVRASLGPEELAEVRLFLQAEYSSRSLDDLRAAVQANDAGAAEELSREILAMQNIEFVSVGKRGTDEVVVRLEIQVDGQDPPDGEPVRYYVMEHSELLGWRVKHEAYWWTYWLKLF